MLVQTLIFGNGPEKLEGNNKNIQEPLSHLLALTDIVPVLPCSLLNYM